MDAINKKYNIEITVLSPLSIGAGAEKDLVKGVDFVVEERGKDKKVYVLNLKKMAQNGIDLQSLTTHFAAKNAEAVLRLVESKLNVVSDMQFDLPMNSDNDIKSFIKNELSGKPIIPGSSLKGAVRSVILNYLLKNETSDVLKDLRTNKSLSEKKYFGNSTDGTELMRFIKFSDAEFEKTALVNTKVFNLQGSGSSWRGGWKYSKNTTDDKYNPTGFNTLYESILLGQKGFCTMMFSKIAFDSIQTHNKKQEKEKLFSITELFKIINQHTKDYIKKEIAFFAKYSTDKTDNIIDSLKHIKAQIPEDNSACILKMSAGSGFHSITGDWQYDDYSTTGIWTEGRNRGKQKYKSRKIAIHNNCFSLMGFVKLELADYKSLILNAELFIDDSKLDNAKNCLEQAKSFVQDGKKVKELMAKVENIISKQNEDYKRAQEILVNQQKMEAERLAANQVPLSEKIKTSNKIPTMAGYIKTWKKLNNVDSLSEADIEVVHAKIKEIYNSLNSSDKKKFSLNPLSEMKIVNKELINQWSNEIKQ